MVPAILLACTEEQGIVQWDEGEQIAEERAVVVRIAPAMSNPPPELRWREETLGLLVAIVETGLAELPDVTAHVGAQPAARFLDPSRIEAELALTLDGGQDTFVLVATLCQPGGHCRDLRATGLRQDPFEAMSRLLVQIAELLGRKGARESIEESMRGSLSKSDYARLLTGRAAAVLYGIMPAPPAPSIGDKRKDPIARAVFLDPEQALAQFVAGRRAISLGKRDAAITAFEAAQRLQPTRAIFTRELAAALEGADWRRAEALYAQLARKMPTDHRFQASRINALIALGRLDEAQHALASLPERYAKVSDVLQMKVAIAEARGELGDSFDVLLSTWQKAAPNHPEPVRRRIAWSIERGDFARALALSGELAKRGATEESVRLKMSLALASGDHQTARESARTLGLTEIDARIGARAMLEAGGDPVEVVTKAKDRNGRLARGELALREGRIQEALGEAIALIRIGPHDVEALALRVRALRRAPHLGDLVEAQAALYFADPETAKRLRIGRPAKRYVPPQLLVAPLTTPHGPVRSATTSVRVATATTASG